MKLVLGCDITDGPAAHADGDALCVARLPADLESEYDRLKDAEQRMRKAADLPLALRLIRTVAGYTALCVFLALAAGLFERGGSGRMHHLDILVPLMLGGFALWLLLRWLGERCAVRVRDSREHSQALRDAEAFTAASAAALGIPPRAVKMDLLACRYVRRDGGIVVQKELNAEVYANIEFSAWREGGFLRLADPVMRFDLPLDSFRSVRIAKKGYTISAWNKPRSFRSPEYKKYGVIVNGGRLLTGRYLAVTLDCGDEEYELRVPRWEADALEALTGWPLR